MFVPWTLHRFGLENLCNSNKTFRDTCVLFRICVTNFDFPFSAVHQPKVGSVHALVPDLKPVKTILS